MIKNLGLKQAFEMPLLIATGLIYTPVYDAIVEYKQYRFKAIVVPCSKPVFGTVYMERLNLRVNPVEGKMEYYPPPSRLHESGRYVYIEVFPDKIVKHYHPGSAFHQGSIRAKKLRGGVLVYLGCPLDSEWDKKHVGRIKCWSKPLYLIMRSTWLRSRSCKSRG